MSKRQLLKLYVTFFGSGLSPKAPGTMGTLAAVVLAIPFLQMIWWMQILVILAICISGVMACEMYEKEFEVHDAGEMVIDEVAGYLISIFFLPLSLVTLVAGFILFRVLDITKPLVIGMADRKLKGGLGVMVDDILAGIVTSLVLQFLYTEFPHIFHQGMLVF